MCWLQEVPRKDRAEVATLCEDIKNAYPKTTPAELVYNGTNLNEAGFNNVATPSWMWGVDLTLAQGLDLISWWGQVDVFTYSYAWAGDPKTIDEGLYDKIRTDDIRKGQFDPPNGGAESDYAADGYAPVISIICRSINSMIRDVLQEGNARLSQTIYI